MSGQPSKDVIFEEALGKPTPEEREAYLDAACRGDASLRNQMARIIDAHLAVGNFLETPVFGADCVSDFAAGRNWPVPTENAAGFKETLPPDWIAPTARADSPGRIGSLEVLELVARGSMGIVWKGFDEKLHREVAIKLLPPEIAVDASARRRFVREARRAASVVNENVIAIHAVDDSGVLPYIVMPFIEGASLQERIKRDGPLSVESALRIGAQIAAGLAAIHARDLVHRDLKPANILIERHGDRVKITDFGVARAVDDPHATQFGLIAGTPAYMSPEQAGGLAVDHRADLFSLGSVLYAMVTGRPPFEGESIVGIIRQVCDHTPKPLRQIDPAIPRAFSDLVAKLHSRRPADRPQSADHVAAELSAQLAQYSGDEFPANSGQFPTHRFSLGRRIAAAGFLFTALALGATEATGVTDMHDTVIRLLQQDGTLAIEVDDPAVSVTLEGTDIVITGTGAQEIRLKPGSYQLSAIRDGKLLRQELVNVSRDGRRVVRISHEPTFQSDGATAAWEKRVSRLSPEEQVAAVVERLKQLNPGYDGHFEWSARENYVFTFDLASDAISDLSPLRVFTSLRSLGCLGTGQGKGKVQELGPLRELPLEFLALANQAVTNLEPLRDMPLQLLILSNCPVEELSHLKGKPLRSLLLQNTSIKNLEPLRGIPLTSIDLHGAVGVSDLSPLEGMPLNYLNVSHLPVAQESWKVISGLQKMKMLVLTGTPLQDLSFLSPLNLVELSFPETEVKDIRPIANMPLERIHLDYLPEFAEILRSMKTLKMINLKPVDEFWRDVEARQGK
ncbi:protein kinase [bacterium]|nr:protein kinase [bacterium]